MNAATLDCDIAIIGGGMGGVAAALAAADAGAQVVLSEPTDWLGGQMTSQGVSALDEHPYIEQFGGTRSYYRMREAIRAHYRDRYAVSPMRTGAALLNPGNGWVSRLCFEPVVGVQVLEALLAPHVAAGRLTILREHVPIACSVEPDRASDVLLQAADGRRRAIRARYVLDATELGELLPLAGVGYTTGAEARADTGERHASSDGPHPDEVQAFTFGFALEYRPGEDHTIAKPEDYEQFRDTQPYTLVLRGHNGEARPFRMFADGPTGLPPFWTYRRLVDGALLDPSGARRDIALINWPSNDYYGINIIDASEAERARGMDAARRLALGFLYWLQTEAPHDDGLDRGYPGLRLLPEVMGTADGLSKAPYIRESRRIVALERITESHIAAGGRVGARAESFHTSVGVGWYHIDVHDCVGNPQSMYAPTLPFQIPLAALLPRCHSNLIAACKNIGTTHLSNGAYRLHPVEWNIGEAAGTFAAFCCATGVAPHHAYADKSQLLRFQRRLLERGVPLAWTIDLALNDRLFVPVQLLVLYGAIAAESPRFHTLALNLDGGVSGVELQAALGAVGRLTAALGSPTLPLGIAQSPELLTRADVAPALAAIGLPAAVLSARPTWRELCAALAPLIDRAITVSDGA